jgi:hypothetical protein
MQVFAYITSALTGTERKLTLKATNQGAAFAFDDTGATERGTYTEAVNKFEALDLLRKIYADSKWNLRFELV